MVIPGEGTFSSGPEYGPGGLQVPGSQKDLSAVWYGQENGTLVKFGKSMENVPSHTYQGDNGSFLRYRDGPGPQSQQEQILRGVHTSKFKKGFQRRQYSDIMQDSLRKEREYIKEQKAAAHLERRRERLTDLTTTRYNGFNPITGQVTAAFKKKDIYNWLLDGQPSKVQVGEGPSAELQRIGHIQLRDSLSRFYLPHYSGPNHDKRQQQMVTEGLRKSKSTSILGVGNSDLHSFGVEDQFSKATYEPNRMCIAEGLVERTAPGRFTPDKTGVWSMKKEPYGSLMSKLSASRSTAHLPRHRATPPTSTFPRNFRASRHSTDFSP